MAGKKKVSLDKKIGRGIRKFAKKVGRNKVVKGIAHRAKGAAEDYVKDKLNKGQAHGEAALLKLESHAAKRISSEVKEAEQKAVSAANKIQHKAGKYIEKKTKPKKKNHN